MCAMAEAVATEPVLLGCATLRAKRLGTGSAASAHGQLPLGAHPAGPMLRPVNPVAPHTKT